MRVTISQIKEMKQSGEKIAMLTSYDYSTAKIVDQTGIPLILVGDSLGMVVLGYESTIPVTMEDMLHHTRAVVRGTKHAMVIGDMPFMSYHISVEDALRNAARFIQEGGAQAVKLEGGVTVADKVRRIVDCGIQQLSGFIDAFVVEHFKFCLPEGRRYFVFYYFYPHPGSDHRIPNLEVFNPADIQTQGSIEFKRAATGGHFRITEHDTDLFAQLVGEYHAGFGMAHRRG